MKTKKTQKTIVDALPVSIHYIEQRIEQIVPYNIVKNLDWMDWETHSKKKARLSYSDANQEPKKSALLSAFIDPKDLTRVTCCVKTDTSCKWTFLPLIDRDTKYHLQTKHGWFGWRIQFWVPVLYIQYQICEKGANPKHKQMMWLNYLEQLSP